MFVLEIKQKKKINLQKRSIKKNKLTQLFGTNIYLTKN